MFHNNNKKGYSEEYPLKKNNNLMKEYKFEKDVWFIIQVENPHGNKLRAGDSLTTINEVVIYETEDQWKSAKSELGIVDIKPFTEPKIKQIKQIKDKSDRGPRVAR